MLQSQRNKQTMDILKRLRQQGAPKPTEAIPLDMAQDMDQGQEQPGPMEPPPEGEEPETEEPSAPAPSPGGIITDMSIPGMGTAQSVINRRKKPVRR